jgi:transcriptional regulator with XRE-family HTH domain
MTLPTDPAELGPALRAARIAAGLSQADLAYLSGVSERQIRSIEYGRHRPRPLTIRCLLGQLPEVTR